MEAQERVQGRWIGPEEIVWLQGWIDQNPLWSRKRIARELCAQWQWLDQRGRIKDFAARSFLLKLQARGCLRLPPLQEHQRRGPRAKVIQADWSPPPPWSARLREVGPVAVEPVQPGSAAAGWWAFYLEQFHYLGLRVVGENLGCLARDRHGRELAALLFGAAAWRCAARDRLLGWSQAQRPERLARIVNNTRFLVLPWVRVPALASHVLGAVGRRIQADWQAKYGHGLEWLETFVERGRFAGTCYRAANWQCVGQTRGRSRQDRDHTCQVPVKDVYLYALSQGRR
jgi:hypothetical protein